MPNSTNDEKKRASVNKPERLIKYLDLLNLLPDNLDDFLKQLSELTEKWRNQQEKLKNVRAENTKRTKRGEEMLPMSGEESEELFYPYHKDLDRLYLDFLDTLPTELKTYIEEHCYNWNYGERKLNMLAVERESIEIIISTRKLWHELQEDFQTWKSEQTTDLSDEKLYESFCNLMKHSPPTIERFNAEKYQFSMPSANLTFLLPSINERLHYHRGTVGSERKGFSGFFTRLAAQGDYLDIAGEGLTGIIIQQKLNGEPPIELDRLRFCESCNKFLYAYKGNQVFCSTACYNASYQHKNRNGVNGLLKRQLKKAKTRLINLKSRLDSDSGLIKDQERKIKEIEEQIELENNKNDTL